MYETLPVRDLTSAVTLLKEMGIEEDLWNLTGAERREVRFRRFLRDEGCDHIDLGRALMGTRLRQEMELAGIPLVL